ncbi:MAG: hypothetical protein KJO69_06420, partial [Gammaproteobacteria bacterium]|nr:hypothetical protein [Gammaproteobacteria bacterium]
RARQAISDTVSDIDIDEQLAELKEIASNISQYVLNMIVVFVLQTLVFPLLFLWLTYRALVAVMQH